MQRIVGVICVVVGVLLLVWGHDVSRSVGSQVQQVFTGAPVDKAMYLYIAGSIVGLFGLGLALWGKK